jgi:hypothetical protein
VCSVENSTPRDSRGVAPLNSTFRRRLLTTDLKHSDHAYTKSEDSTLYRSELGLQQKSESHPKSTLVVRFCHISQTERAHIGPSVLDVCQTFRPCTFKTGILPSQSIFSTSRPYGELFFVINYYSIKSYILLLIYIHAPPTSASGKPAFSDLIWPLPYLARPSLVKFDDWR